MLTVNRFFDMELLSATMWKDDMVVNQRSGMVHRVLSERTACGVSIADAKSISAEDVDVESTPFCMKCFCSELRSAKLGRSPADQA
eukprot:4619360-Amphidinium_carterae.1